MDDLGYGDTSLAPFTTPRARQTTATSAKSDDDSNWPCQLGGYLTPSLEAMAKKGLTMTNFHSAAPVCSPARASIMTGIKLV